MTSLKLITVCLTKQSLKDLQKLVELGYYPNRSEAIRAFVRDGIEFHEETVRRKRK